MTNEQVTLLRYAKIPEAADDIDGLVDEDDSHVLGFGNRRPKRGQEFVYCDLKSSRLLCQC